MQGDSENIDGAAASISQKSTKEPEVTEDVRLLFPFIIVLKWFVLFVLSELQNF